MIQNNTTFVCNLFSKIILSSFHCNKLFSYYEINSNNDEYLPQIDQYTVLSICLCLNLFGVSNLAKTIAFAILCLLELTLYIDASRNILPSMLLEKIELTNLFLLFCMFSCGISIFLRYCEVKYGPRRIPDVHRSFSSFVFLRRLFVRRLRQFVEFAIFTVIPGYYFHCYIFNEDIIGITHQFNHYCDNSSNMNLINKIQQEHPTDFNSFIQGYLVTIICCGVIQRVFGSNPSYKTSIFDQYGHSLLSQDNISVLDSAKDENGINDRKLDERTINNGELNSLNDSDSAANHDIMNGDEIKSSNEEPNSAAPVQRTSNRQKRKPTDIYANRFMG